MLKGMLMEFLLPLSTPIIALKGICVASSLALMLSGLADIIPMWTSKRVGAKSSTPYVVSLVDTAIGLWFSSMIGDDIGKALRALNLGLLAIYIGTFLRFGNTVAVGRASATAVGAIVAVVAGLLAGVKSEAIRTDILGLMCTATAIAFAAAPLYDVFRTSNVAMISRPLAGALLVCASAWAVYGAVGTRNIWMVIPNAVNAVLAATQLGLSFASPWKTTATTGTTTTRAGAAHRETGRGAPGTATTTGVQTKGVATGTGTGTHVGQTKAASRGGGATGTGAGTTTATAMEHDDTVMDGRHGTGTTGTTGTTATTAMIYGPGDDSEKVGAVAAAGPISGDVLASAATRVDAQQGMAVPEHYHVHDEQMMMQGGGGSGGIRQRRGSTDGAITSPTKGSRRGSSPGPQAGLMGAGQPGSRRGTSPRRSP